MVTTSRMLPHLEEQQGHLLTRSSTGSWVPSGRGSSNGVERGLLALNWMESNLTIASKAGELIPLVLNDAQAILLMFVVMCWHQGARVRCLVPKLRQGGISTAIQALAFTLAVIADKIGQVFRAGTVAHIEDSSKFIFSMSRRFESNLPTSWQRPLESRTAGRIEWKGGSWIQVASARLGDALFKGPSLNLFHASEVANWADAGVDASAAWTSATNALAPGPGSMAFAESTAKGRDKFFWLKIKASLAGRGAERIVFLPWPLESGYSMTWAQYRAERPHQNLARRFEATREEKELREELRAVVVREGEEWHRYRFDLTDEQLIWRRSQTEAECDGKPEVFRRYYPGTIEEAFASSEHSKFDEETIAYYDGETRQPEIGVLERRDDGTIEFRKEEGGWLLLWDRPRAGHEYVVGADVSGERMDDGEGSDFDVADIMSKRTLTTVALVHGQFQPDVFAAHLALVGRWWNDALLAPENNRPQVAVALRKLGYPRLYRFKSPEAPESDPGRPGWSTSRRSRPVIVDHLEEHARKRSFRSFDRGFVVEMSSFVLNEKKRMYAAPKGEHDDRVLAKAIALYLCTRSAKDLAAALGGGAAKPIEQDDGKVYRAFLAEQERDRERGAAEGGEWNFV